MQLDLAIVAALSDALGEDAPSAGEIASLLTSPPKIDMGDRAFPCFTLAKVRREAPPKIAATLAARIAERLAPRGPIARVEAAGPYVNFFADPAAQLGDLAARLADGRFEALLATSKPERVMIEFSQPNTHKPFHVGHLRNVTIGNALVRVHRARGHDVVAANYYGDFGIDVAKCLWWIRTHPAESVPAEGRIAWLGSCYERATALLAATAESDAEASTRLRAEVRAVLHEMESQTGPVYDLYRETRQWCLDAFADVYRRLDVSFDHDFFESEVEAEGQRIVDDGLARGVFVQSQGAVICDLEAEGLGACLVRKSDGTSLYMTWDLALAKRKFDQFGIERSLYVVGAEQRHHFQQLFATLAHMGYERARDCRHIAYELVMLPTGKMSSRKGTAVPLHALWQSVGDSIRAKLAGEERPERATWSAAEHAAIVEQVTVASLVYGMLRTSHNRSVIFDVDAWTQPEGDTGAYLLYALARIAGLRRKTDGRLPSLGDGVPPTPDFGHESERALLNHLLSFPDVVARVENTCDPALLAAFLFDATKIFSRFYAQCPVLKAPEPLRTARLQLVGVAEAILRRGFTLLGLPVLDAM